MNNEATDKQRNAMTSLFGRTTSSKNEGNLSLKEMDEFVGRARDYYKTPKIKRDKKMNKVNMQTEDYKKYVFTEQADRSWILTWEDCGEQVSEVFTEEEKSFYGDKIIKDIPVDIFSILGMRNLSAFIGELFAKSLAKESKNRFCLPVF